jgi:hypothetical protein
MRYPTQLLLLPLVFGLSRPAAAQSSDVPASVRWNRLVPSILDEAAARRRALRAAAQAAQDSATLRRLAQSPQPILFTIYTRLGLAQYGAVNTARADRNVSSDIAVAAASAAVLSDLFTDSAVRATIARELARDAAKSRAARRVAASKSIGEDVARRVIAWAPQLNLVSPWNGTIPKGPGMWYSAPGIPPIGISLATARGWVLDSASQFRPAPPPAFGSAAWNAAMSEVQRVARERTREQTAIAQKWTSGDPWAVWNEKASDAIRRHGMSELESARVLAVLNIAASDAVIACFEAKYHYWTIRPSQADTTLALANNVQLPNFPSFPSGHACSAGAFGEVLIHFFPSERAQFTQISEEQAMSRLYGGIHYRFDNDGGLALGRVVARYVIDRERSGGFNAWRAAAAVRKQ